MCLIVRTLDWMLCGEGECYHGTTVAVPKFCPPPPLPTSPDLTVRWGGYSGTLRYLYMYNVVLHAHMYAYIYHALSPMHLRTLTHTHTHPQSLAQYGFRRASDTVMTSLRPSGHSWPSNVGKFSPQLPVHRERAMVMVADATITAATAAKKIGKGLSSHLKSSLL